MLMFRLDYLATVYVAHPLSRLGKRRADGSFPFLMYHSISPSDGSAQAYYDVCTDPKSFRKQMMQLSKAGRKGVSVREVLRQMEIGTTADNLTVLTFDDGFRDVLTEAVPIMQEFGFTATVYAIAEKSTAVRSTFKDRECMTSAELRQLANVGYEIGSHTVSHPRLYELPWEKIEAEVKQSKRALEDSIGQPVDAFCYPYAYPEADRNFSTRFEQLIRECGYTSNVTTIIGTAKRDSDRFRLPRLPVNSWDDEKLLAAKLDGAYDWLHVPQLGFKRLKQVVARRNGA